MLSFKQYLQEAKAIYDYRTHTDQPYYLGRRLSDEYPVVDNRIQFDKPKIHSKSSTIALYQDKDQKKSEGYHSSLVKIDPKSKTVDFRVNTEAQCRRENKKFTSNSDNRPKKATPILGGEIDSNISHLDIRKHIQAAHDHLGLHDYTVIGDDRWHGMSVPKFLKEKTNHEKMQAGLPITVYHGTSTKRAKDILQNGIVPGARKETYMDLRHGYSEHNTYFHESPQGAANYATREALQQGSQPAILAVTIHPHQHPNIRRDEDHGFHWMKDSIKSKTLDAFNKEFPVPNNDIHFRHIINTGKPTWQNWKDPVNRTSFERAEQEKIGKRAVQMYDNRGVGSHPNFAYKGKIPATQISVHKSWRMQSIPHPNSTVDQWKAAHDKMETSVKHGKL